MEQVDQYLQHAKECLAQAAETRNPKIKAELEELATKWQKLASDREEFLKSSGRVQDRRRPG